MCAKKRDSKVTSRIMSCIRSKNTRPELALAKALRRNGLKYKTHYKIAGRPDFVILSRKIAIFVDGDFWHGHNWKLRGFKNLKEELASYKKFWVKKIVTNIQRDKRASRELRKNKWKVLRFWESDIKRDVDRIANKILFVYKISKPAL